MDKQTKRAITAKAAQNALQACAGILAIDHIAAKSRPQSWMEGHGCMADVLPRRNDSKLICYDVVLSSPDLEVPIMLVSTDSELAAREVAAQFNHWLTKKGAR